MIITDKQEIQLRVEEQGFALMFDATTTTTFTLNPTASWLWTQIEPGIDLQTLLQRARSEYNIAPDTMQQVAEEVVDCILSWWMDGLIAIAAAGRPLQQPTTTDCPADARNRS